MVYTDSHAHLSLVAEELGQPFVDELLRSYEAAWSDEGEGQALLVDPGVEPDDLPQRRARCGKHGFLRYAAGIWPSTEALSDPSSALALLAATLQAARSAGESAAAIGEGGLDYFHMNGDREAQRSLFEGQIELAEAHGLPLIVHSRDAAADTLDLLRARKPRIPVLLHCYGYGAEELDGFLALGCYVSFAGNLTYKSAGRLREACAALPSERLLLETDAPYMNPMPRRGKPSSPLDISRTYETAAALRGLKTEELASIVSANARLIFGEL